MKPLSIIHLRGSQAEMGHQYGLIVKENGVLEDAERTLMSLHLRLLKDANHKTVAGRATAALFRGICAYGTWRMTNNRPQEYVERNRAFFAAVDYDRKEVRHMVGMDVFQNVVGLAGRYRIKPLADFSNRAIFASCSSLAAWGEATVDTQLRHARNFDFPAIGVWEQRPTVVYCEPDDGLCYGYVGTFGVDVPGTTGFNEAGLTVAAHTRFHRDVRFDGAAIMDLCHDIIRRAETIEDAERIVRERPVASTWGLMISSANDGYAAVLETTGEAIRLVRARGRESFVTCSNLHRHPELIDDQVIPFPAWTEHADGRERRLRQLAESGSLTDGDFMSALGDNCDPDCQEPARPAGGVLAQAMSVTSVVFRPEAKSMLLSVGDTPTGWGPYVKLDWDWSAEVGRRDTEDYAIARERRGFEAPALERAYRYWREVSRVDAETHDEEAVLTLVDKAIAEDGATASFRLLAGLLRLRKAEWTEALEQFEAGKDLPQSSFRRGQFLLWGSRTLHTLGRQADAKAWRAELLRSSGPHLYALHELAVEDAKRGVSAGKLRRVIYNVDLVDASLP
jgi:hypothetical protein